jgi:hypothetical protein
MAAFDRIQVEHQLRAKLKDWLALLRRRGVGAHDMLAALINGRITFRPEPETGNYPFSGTGTFDALIEGIVPAEIGPSVWRARREARLKVSLEGLVKAA